MHLKVQSAKHRLFRSGLNIIRQVIETDHMHPNSYFMLYHMQTSHVAISFGYSFKQLLQRLY